MSSEPVASIGSAPLSERLYQVDPQQHRLDIGVPFLAFDYDEFRFKTLHSRAQKFEVLLGQPEFPTDVDERLDDPDNTDPTKRGRGRCNEYLGCSIGVPTR